MKVKFIALITILLLYALASVGCATPVPLTPAPLLVPSVEGEAARATVQPTALTPMPLETPAAPLDLAMRQSVFDEVWEIINTHYLYTDFGGVDWAAVYAEFAPRIAQAPSDEEFYEQIEAMVGRLGDEHSRFLPPQAAQRQDALSSGREEQVGIGATYRDVGDGLILQHVFPGGPAERAGLHERDRIVAINGAFYRMGRLEGDEGSEVRLTVLRPGEASHDIVLTRTRIEGQITPLAQRLPGEIGYLKITTLWVVDMDVQVSRALAQLSAEHALRGLIIDLRSNPGGWRSVMQGILSHFITGDVGAFTSRDGDVPLHIPSSGNPDLRDIPLAVLVDERTASYAEVIAAILQGQAGAVVIGMPTSGNTETIYSYELTGGGRLWVAQEGFALPDGSDLEGLGVQPDVAILEDWTRFSEANDPGIARALRMLSPQAGGN
ncbi:MAG: PDZ domain-containing protein [Candidatus Viridilinea halotolerans]|uniref:PDZ domain-containing protein n=1 Tax=Candidatus Viridilinea halotolerans TaxID=2491704 RepID=A0A426TU21_9CHLR|nr:MAG: PDZ domain-containing protein [Candidatus Viridilinea halotolerans]